MSLPIREIRWNATVRQLNEAISWTADHLHVPTASISDEVAVAYVVRHFKSGRLEGWEGFLEATTTKPRLMTTGEFVSMVTGGPNWNK